MTALIDTSAIVAYLVERDPNHASAVQTLERLIDEGDRPLIHSHAVVETIALLQARGGVHAVSQYALGIEPSLHIRWVDEPLHRRGLAALLSGQRGVSLVDWISFEVMHEEGIATAFAFDGDFAAQGFTVVP